MENESIIGVIVNASKKKSLFKRTTYNIIVTNKRLLFAELTADMLKQAAKDATEESKAAGENIFKRMAKTATSGFSFHKRYLEMTPEAILAEQPENYALEATQIEKFKTKMGDIEYNTPNKLILFSSRGKESFDIQSNISEAKKLLNQLLQS